MKIQPLDASANRFDSGSVLCVESKGQRRLIEVKSSRRQGKAIICDFGILALEEAEALINSTLWIHRSMRPPLPEGEFYLDEMIGFQVQSENGEDLGEVVEVLETAAHNVYVTTNAMIPAHADFILTTDWQNKVLIVRDLPGLKT